MSDEQILRATRAAVLAHGRTVTLEEIATTVGISAPALLHRFGTQKALLLAALRPPRRPKVIEMLEQPPTPPAFRPNLEALLGALSEYASEALPYLSALTASEVPVMNIFPKGRPPTLILDALKKWLRAAAKDGTISATAAEADAAALAIAGAALVGTTLSRFGGAPPSPRSQRRYRAEEIGRAHV